MFIREQMIDTLYDLKAAYHDDAEFVHVWVWSPVSCRHVRWVFP
jgi:hypothetical protein